MSEALEDIFRITLLGTGAPPPSVDRFGPSTLVEVGREKFIFDAGRGAMQRLYQLGIPFSEITGIFLTHHHSDHVVGFPDLWLTGWIGRPWGKRCAPLSVWGPAGTKEMMEHLAKAFHVDIRVRGKSYPPDGVTLVAGEIIEGTVFAEDGIGQRVQSRSRRGGFTGVRISNRLSRSRGGIVRGHNFQRKPDRTCARGGSFGTRGHCGCRKCG